MASVKYSGLVSEIKGSVGGATFQKCGQSLSVRSNPSHRMASGSFASLSRLQFGAIANAWSQLNASERAAWAAVSSGYVYYDKWGNVIILSAYQLFMSINRFLVVSGFQIITVPAAYSPLSSVGVIFDPLYYNINMWQFTVTTSTPANSRVVIFVSEPYIYRSNFVASPTMFLVSASVTSSVYYELGLIVRERLKLPIKEGVTIFAEAWQIDTTTGIVLKEFEIECPATFYSS